MSVVFIVFCVVCAFLGMFLGEKRRIGATAGFLLGLLLGVIGLIIVILSRRVPSGEPARGPVSVANPTSSKDNGPVVKNNGVQTNVHVVNEEGSREHDWIYEDGPKDAEGPASRTKAPLRTDDSVLVTNRNQDASFIDELALEVCLHGDQLDKYERIMVKKYSSDTYDLLGRFVEEVSRSVQKGKFTNTSVANLGYLGKSAGLSESTVEEIIKKCSLSSLVNSLSSK